jgi:hypothetical protein
MFTALLHITFWISAALAVYAYAGYPLALAALSLVRSRPVLKARITPRVTFIITAHNEAERIHAKLANTLRQRYPTTALEIIVASDCSTDGTDEAVREYAGRVRLVRSPVRRGKEAAQHLAIQSASGDILIFSDVATLLDSHGVAMIVQNFADPTVGCVSSIDKFIDADGRVSGEGAYVQYEMRLRALETAVNSLVGLSGSFFAARREVCRQWAVDRQSDFSTLLASVRQGLRGVLDPDSVGYYPAIADERHEFQRKVRTVARGIAALGRHRSLLNPMRNGLFAWQLASHKVCRWLVPFAMIGAALTSLALAPGSPFFQAVLLAQAAFYAAALAGLRLQSTALRIPAFLVVANAAVLMAWMHIARGDRFTSWTPSRRIRTFPEFGSH